eukprot:scaffold74705_cov23-Cyclotella_meneghiniana.AAC.1
MIRSRDLSIAIRPFFLSPKSEKAGSFPAIIISCFLLVACSSINQLWLFLATTRHGIRLLHPPPRQQPQLPGHTQSPFLNQAADRHCRNW